MTSGAQTMSFDPESFTVHDVSAFPVVRPRNAGMTEGYAPQWVSEMEALLARGEPYVLVLEGVRATRPTRTASSAGSG